MRVKEQIITRLDDLAVEFIQGTLSAFWLYIHAAKLGMPDVMAYCMHLMRTGAAISATAFVYKKRIEEM